MRQQRLVIMLKEPVAGRVKTRLGADIGMTNAAWWFRHQTSQLLRNLGGDPRWQLILAVSPDIALHSRTWPSHFRRIAQGRGDLGARMTQVLETAWQGPTIIIGGDIPGITTQIINAAFKKLRAKEIVFGPAKDGGFWLVGAKGGSAPLPKNLFKNVRWSSEFALQDSLAALKQANIGFADTLQDIDRAADLRHL